MAGLSAVPALACFTLALVLAAGPPAHAALFGNGKDRRTEATGTATLDHGPFRIVAQGRRISTGTFPNQGGNPFATMEVTGFSVYHQGKPVVVKHGSRTLAQFWRVATLPGAPRPALLVSTTDFHLITVEDGIPVVQSIGRPSTDMADWQWLDGDDGQPSEVGSFGIQKVPVDQIALTGGRYLLLSAQAVLDVHTLRLQPVDYHVPQGRPLQGVGGTRALHFSPGRTQYVTYGFSVTLVENNDYVTGLSVVDIGNGEAYGLPLAPGQKRFRDEEDLTARWFAHYYAWQRDAAGRERLVERPNVAPLPRAGRLVPHVIRLAGRDGVTRYPTMTYVLRPATEALVVALESFAVERFAAQRVRAPHQYERDALQVPGCPGGMRASIFFGSENVMRVVLEAVSSSYDDRVTCAPVIEKIGRTFEDELARGRYQELFAE